MNDRELLELAAKAFRINYAYDLEGYTLDFNSHSTFIAWNPLLDDGDAFRLANSLNMDIYIHQISVVVAYGDVSFTESCAGKSDRASATRRAIVRAAAEIGKSK